MNCTDAYREALTGTHRAAQRQGGTGSDGAERNSSAAAEPDPSRPSDVERDDRPPHQPRQVACDG